MEDNYSETFDTWNKLALLYQEKFMDLDAYNDTYDFICNTLTKHRARLLEIGCGPGNISKYLLSRRPDFDLLGIDIAPNMIELARKNNPTAQFAVMDCRHINRINSKFDGIIAGFCLPYLSPTECNELITTAYDLLNENGLIYLSFVEGNPDKPEFKESNLGRVYFQYHDLDELKSQLTGAHFDELETFRVNYKTSETTFDMHTIVTAKKTQHPAQ